MEVLKIDHIIEVVTCLVRNEIVKESVVNVVKAVKTKDLSTIVSTVVSAYRTAKDDVKQCLQFEPVLKGCGQKYFACINNCPLGDIFGDCRKDCYNAYC